MRIRSEYVRPFVLALVLGLLAAATPVCGQSGRKVTKLADGVCEIQHEPSGNTTVIIGKRQIFVVDTCHHGLPVTRSSVRIVSNRNY
jgi:hypothetical protein